MTEYNSPLIVSALITTRSNPDGLTEILNVLAYNKDKYGFPGGKLDKDELPEQAVIRETQEELGVAPNNIVYQRAFKALTPEGRGIEMHVFSGEVPENIAPTNEIAELHWMTIEQMENNLDLLTPMTIEQVLPFLKTYIHH